MANLPTKHVFAIAEIAAKFANQCALAPFVPSGGGLSHRLLATMAAAVPLPQLPRSQPGNPPNLYSDCQNCTVKLKNVKKFVTEGTYLGATEFVVFSALRTQHAVLFTAAIAAAIFYPPPPPDRLYGTGYFGKRLYNTFSTL